MKYPDIFNPDLSRIGVQESQMYNLVAGELVTHPVRTALGPRGMSKVYIDILGEETVTSHGGAFLRKIDVDHPAAKTVVDAVNTVDNHVGDGTTTTAVLVGALLRHAREMRRLRIPTASIIEGYEEGLRIATAELGRTRFAADAGDRGTMRELVLCSIAGKDLWEVCAGSMTTGKKKDDKPDIVEMLLDAVYCTSDIRARRASTDDVKIEEKPGNADQTMLVRGTVIDKPVDSDAMPRSVCDARILLVSESLERSRTKTESEITITAPYQREKFLKREADYVSEAAQSVASSGANVVISRKGIDDETQESLARLGIVSVRRVKHNDIWWLEKSTGAVTCTDIRDISSAELGRASSVYEKSVGGDRMLFVESARNDPRSVTLLLRANSKRYLDEFHRTALNALYVMRNFVEMPYLVYGGGACEAFLADRVRTESRCLPGKVQVAASMFADALESIPMTLAVNAGIDALDALPRLRFLIGTRARGRGRVSPEKNGYGRRDVSKSKSNSGSSGRVSDNRVKAFHNEDSDSAHNIQRDKASKGSTKWYGIDYASRTIRDMSSMTPRVIESYSVKVQVLKSSVEAACAVLNVDDVFVKDLIDNTHCHIDGTVHAHKDPGRNHNHWEQEGLEQRQMHHYY